MSSIVTEDFVPGNKLCICVTENGHTLELECDGSTAVEAVQRYIESLSGIHFNNQLLLCLDMKLESHRPLSSYKLPCDDREVFVFNRARLHLDSPLPPPEQIEVPEITESGSPSPSREPHPLDDALDPALKALPSYERQFRYHFQCGNAIYSCTQEKFEVCKRLLKEHRVQERALETASGSMDHYYKMIYQMCLDFFKCFSQQNRYHSDILANFGRDIDKLKLCKLHPDLQTESRKCLLDLVKEENLRKWAENCAGSHRQFETKVSQFKSLFMELKHRVEDLFSTKAPTDVKHLERMIKGHQRCLNDQKSIMQSLSKDVNTVKKLVDDCLSSQLSASLRPHDAVSALGPMYEVHDKNHLPTMKSCDSTISKLLNFCKDKKGEMNFFVHNCMQQVAYVQSIIRDVRLQFPAFKEAMDRQDDIFADLKLVRGIGPAYRACLAEVVRRKASMKLYMGMAGQLAERLAAWREAEVRTREEFLRTQSAYIPHDILASMGLFDSPNQCDVNIVPFDGNLLAVDIADLDRYAPEHLVGLSSKSDKHTTPKGSFAMSNDSCKLAEGEEDSVDTHEKGDSEELFEGCGSVEIAGTSKMEVENARLRAELASAIARICSYGPQIEHGPLDESERDGLLKTTAEKTSEALHLKDEYVKHLQSVLKTKQMQCLSYEKRIRDLEQRLSDQYLKGQKLSGSKDASEFALSTLKTDDCKSELSGDVEAHMPYISTEPMDEASFTSASLDLKVKVREGVDEDMADITGVLNLQVIDSACNSMDALMLDPHRDELQLGGKDGKEKMATELGLALIDSSIAESLVEPLSMIPCGTAVELSSSSKPRDDLVLELQSALADKSNQCDETETKLKVALEEVNVLRRELEASQKLLDESQMNCAHLENCLHEAREEAQTNLCAAERRASEYSALRASAIKMRGLFERFRNCVNASGGVAGFADSLRSLALSLASSINDNEEDGTADLRACIKVLADKVGFLLRQRAELLDRCSRAETVHGQLTTELEEKRELVNSLYAKHQLEKQANKEKISFGRFEVHEIAAFIPNSLGHYEAVNRNCSNYFLSAESIALFAEHLPSRPSYIIGQIVHVERKTVKPLKPIQSDHGNQLDFPGPNASNNPYDLPVGCEYFVVTVAMLPDTIHFLPS